MTLGFPSAPSVIAGQPLSFHVSTEAPEFRIEIYRQGATLAHEATSAWIPAERFPILASYDDWTKVWRGHAFPIPADWPSGAYVAMFVEGDGQGRERASQSVDRRSAHGPDAKALFVVRSPEPRSPILYKLPLFTYAAYNAEGDPRGSLYLYPDRKVSLRRPGNGTGGTPWDADVEDVYDLSSPRQTFAHWDAKFIRWLEENGHHVDYATDLDIHRGPEEWLASYRLMLSVGHDEYWSDAMRDHVERFVARGGNVAFWSGNVAYWRVHVDEGDLSLSIDKRVHPDDRGSFDSFARVRPENTLTGVAYGNAGGQWNGPRPSGGGYTVERADHWVFEGTGLARGAVFGEAQAVVGYEADGAALTRSPRGFPITTGKDCSPLDFDILATSDVSGWEGANAGCASTATMGIYTRGGIVFNAATTDWARVLAVGDPIVDRITRNVIDALSRRALTIAGPFPTRFGRAVAVERETGTFYVDTSALPRARGRLTFRWLASAGTTGPLDGPSFDVVMPSPPVPVTISVAVGCEGDPLIAFGTLTVEPYTKTEAAWFDALVEIARITHAGRPADRARMRPGEGAACLSAYLYDPFDPALPFFPRPEAPPSPSVLRAIRESALRLAELVRVLGGT